MENDDFAAPIYILMIAAACHIICNNQRGQRTWVRPWIQRTREVGQDRANKPIMKKVNKVIL
jgi:hypothetical protein